MRTRLFRLRSLPSDFWPVWARIQETNPVLESPFFSPDFAKAVAEVRDDAEVGVVFDGDAPAGFFPFHRGFLGVGKPLGLHLSDYQAVISPANRSWNPPELIRGCGLSGWDFDHMLASLEGFSSFSKFRGTSPFVDLSCGFEKYRNDRRQAGSRAFKDLGTQARRMEREVGPLVFEFHSANNELFETLLRWKRTQYQETGVRDVFSEEWTVALLRRIWRTQMDSLSGVVSILRVGDQPIAMHLGMRSRSVWHYWFPTYDPTFRRYSPGLLLLVEMMKAANSHGLTKIDFGKGDADYKIKFMTGATSLLEGAVVVSSSVDWFRRSWEATRSCLRKTLRYPARLLRRCLPKRNRESVKN